jgi:hypothetical protein
LPGTNEPESFIMRGVSTSNDGKGKTRRLR